MVMALLRSAPARLARRWIISLAIAAAMAGAPRALAQSLTTSLPESQRPQIEPPPHGVLGFSQGESPGGASLADFVHLRGARINHLQGLGIVAGLQNTGDNQMALYSIQLVLNTLEHEGVTLPPSLLTSPLMIMPIDLASVTVTAEMPSYSRKGTRLDVWVSALGNATSIQGGNLLMTPLKGTDGQVYAVAQGPVSIAGYFAGAMGASVSTNFQTSGQIPLGATVERQVAGNFPNDSVVQLDLEEPDAEVAETVAEAVHGYFKSSSAVAESPGSVKVELAPGVTPATLVAALGKIKINPPMSDKVVVNEKTGTVVIGGDVTVGKASVSYGDYTVTIQPQLQVSQPNAFATGRTVALRTARVGLKQQKSRFFMTPQGASVAQVTETLNAVGVKPTDTVAIFEALKQAGVLYGRLVVR
jgi:flagellar P-ring protein precursor FlgI